MNKKVDWNTHAMRRHLKRRYLREKGFRFCGLFAVYAGFLSLVLILGSIFSSGYAAFFKTTIALDVHLDPEVLFADIPANSADDDLRISQGDYHTVLRTAVYANFPEVTERKQRRALTAFFSSGAVDELSRAVVSRPELIGQTKRFWLTAVSDIDQVYKGNIPLDVPEEIRRLDGIQLELFRRLERENRLKTVFNLNFFFHGDSRSAELAGIGGALLGSLFTIGVCFLLSFPVAVASAIYLEEFAPKNRWTEAIEISINNLAAVPSIVFGLLGLAVLLNFFALPRGTPLVGGMVLALMTFPVIIVACRASLKAVSPSIREGALAMGASKMQMVLHHVLPLALPGTLTGTIIGLARALGETAPLLMIGMVAFIVDIPKSPLETAAVLPVQIYLWAESAERGFVEKTSAAIMVILAFLVLMNMTAVFLRAKYEKRL